MIDMGMDGSCWFLDWDRLAGGFAHAGERMHDQLAYLLS
jgi:hypothetical protein